MSVTLLIDLCFRKISLCMLQCCTLCLVIKNLDEAINLYVGICGVYVLEKKQEFLWKNTQEMGDFCCL